MVHAGAANGDLEVIGKSLNALALKLCQHTQSRRSALNERAGNALDLMVGRAERLNRSVPQVDVRVVVPVLTDDLRMTVVLLPDVDVLQVLGDDKLILVTRIRLRLAGNLLVRF